MTKIRHDVESLSLQTNELQVSKVDDSKLQSVIDQLEAILSSKVDNSTLSEQYVNLSKLEDELNSARKAMYAELDQRIDPETGERIRVGRLDMLFLKNVYTYNDLHHEVDTFLCFVISFCWGWANGDGW